MACAILLLFVPYNLFIGKQLLKKSRPYEADAKSDESDHKKQQAGTAEQATENKCKLSEDTEL